jgi:hypothetical protein
MRWTQIFFFVALGSCGVDRSTREEAPQPIKPVPPSLPVAKTPCQLQPGQHLSFSLWQDNKQIDIKDHAATIRSSYFSLWVCFRPKETIAINASFEEDHLLRHAAAGGPLFSSPMCMPMPCTGCDARCEIPVGKGGFLGPFDGARTFAQTLFHSGNDLLFSDDSVNGYLYTSPTEYTFNEVKVLDGGVIAGRVEVERFWMVDTDFKMSAAEVDEQGPIFLVFMSRSANIENQRDWLTLHYAKSAP